MVLFTVQLLEHEILVGDQVQMLLEMEETNKALDKAIQSGDAQLGTQERERERLTHNTNFVSAIICIHTHNTVCSTMLALAF